MRFQVPQFIEIEDKIFGPLTFKQFIYIAGGGGVCVVLFTFLPNFLAVLISLPIAVFSAALAFYKINDKPFISLVESFLHYSMGNKLYVWKKEDKKPVAKTSQPGQMGQIEQVHVPKLSESKLKELTWSLDIKESQNPVTTDEKDGL